MLLHDLAHNIKSEAQPPTCRSISTFNLEEAVEQQRLGKPGWTREVEKMTRWGATVTDAEKEPLVDYLVKSYGLRSLK